MRLGSHRASRFASPIPLRAAGGNRQSLRTWPAATKQLGNHVEALRHFDLALAREPKMAHCWRSACFSACVLEAWQKMRDSALGAAELIPKDDYVWQQPRSRGRSSAAPKKQWQLAGVRSRSTKTTGLPPRTWPSTFALENPEWAPLLIRAFRLIPSLGKDEEFKHMHEQAKTMV